MKSRFVNSHINLIVFLILTFLVSISCFQIFALGFINDEWLTLGYVRGVGVFAGFINRLSVFDILLGKGRVLGSIINNIFLVYFDNNPLPFSIFAIVFHLINSYLVYLVAKELTGKKSVSFVAACIFSVPAAAHQAISWLAASVQTLGGMTFILIAVLTAISGLKKKNRLQQTCAWLFAYIAFLFKESSFFVFPILLLLPYVLPNKKKTVNSKKGLILLLLFVLLGFLKIVPFLGLGVNGVTFGDSIILMGKALLNMVMYPLITFSQFLIPFRFMLRFSLSFSGFFYSFLAGAGESNRAASVVVADLLSITFSFSLLFLLLCVYIKGKSFRKNLIFAFCWYILSFIPMAIFLPERNTSYLESRYLYFTFFPIAMVLGMFFYELAVWFEFLFKSKKIAWGIVIALISLFLYKQMTLIQREIRQNIVYANDIQKAMKLTKDLFPTLPDKPIFFVEGDKKYYYANINLPFQEGIGYMLALTYRGSPVIPDELLHMNYLAKQEAQGYQEVGGKGFGYFGNRDDLLDFFRKHPEIKTDQIVSMYYYGYTENLIDTSSSIRKFIEMNR